MTKMAARIGYWPGKDGKIPNICMGFGYDATHWIVNHGGQFEVSIDRNRLLTITLKAEGKSLVSLGDKSLFPFDHGFRFNLTEPSRHFELKCELPYFEYMAADLVVSPCGTKLTYQLPADHLLPWPSKRSLAHQEDVNLFCEEAVMVRCSSLVASGLAGFSSEMALPKHIREGAPGAFARSMKVARDLNGID